MPVWEFSSVEKGAAWIFSGQPLLASDIQVQAVYPALHRRAGRAAVKMISAVENGDKAMRPENIIKICECLSISTDYLLCGKSVRLGLLAEYDEIKRLSHQQREALSKIIEAFFTAFET